MLTCMLLVELTGATSEVGLLRWIFIPVSSRLLSPASSWVCGGWGANQSQPKYVRRRALPPCSTAHHPIRPRRDGFSPLLCRNQQIWLLLVKTEVRLDGARQGASVSAGIVAAPACHPPVSEWHRLVNEHRRAFRRRADGAQPSQSTSEISKNFTLASFLHI